MNQPQPFCHCRVIEGRWMSACIHHEQQYLALTRKALENYEKLRRHAYEPGAKETLQ